jgi:hypothetical protein
MNQENQQTKFNLIHITMKAFFKIVVFAMLFLFLFSVTSCRVVYPNRQHDNGKHKGWYKKAKPRPKKHKRDNQSQSQFKGQESDNLLSVSDYFKWNPETTLKTVNTENPNE